jgi:hypothetical protein
MSSVIIAGNTSGSVTLSAPAVAGTVTVTLPSTSGTMAVTGASQSFTNITATGTIQGASTIGVGNATPSTSGAGITFPATQSASTDVNTLDDYEEGTFTPTVTPAAGAFTTLTNVSGSYTKIGNVVNIVMTYTISSIGTASGAVTIGNLPFSGIANRYAGVTREIAVNGFGGSVYFNSSTTLNQDTYNGGSPIAAGAYWLINLQYYA